MRSNTSSSSQVDNNTQSHERKVDMPQAPLLEQNLTEQEIQKLLNEIENQVELWTGWKTWVSGILSFITAGATASSSPYFANILFDGKVMQKILSADQTLLKNRLKNATTIAAATPSFALSFSANFNVWNRLLRTSIRREDIRQNMLPLALTALSAIVSFKVNWDAWKHTPSWLRIALSAGRGVSALSTNGLFALQMQKNLRGNKECHEIFTLLATQKKLQNLALTNADEYISVMSQSGLFTHLINMKANRSGNVKEDLNSVFRSLLHVLGSGDPIIPDAPQSSYKKSLYVLTGTAASVSYFQSGKTVVPELFGIKGEFALWSLGSLLGISSLAVNSAIASIAIADAMERLANKNTQYAKSDIVWLPFKLYFLLGFSLANAGMALEYPSPVDNKILGWVESVINFFVYLAIGDMSFDSFFSKMNSGYYASWKTLLENAKKAGEEGLSLETHYNTLNDTDKVMLVRLIEEYRKWAFESLTDFFNQAHNDITNQLFFPEIKEQLAKQHPNMDEKQESSDEQETKQHASSSSRPIPTSNSGNNSSTLLSPPLTFLHSPTPTTLHNQHEGLNHRRTSRSSSR
ncbi:MAG: hypothetical protein ACD_45C00296G0009 [uncultured bacterium]|nr:MAG: hypothetical protein ACD_45C00296G0009 [uncultured bacterium]